jgi:Ca-activated chloride channel family protein
MAKLARGKFYRATNRQELQNIYDEIDHLEKTQVKLRRYVTFTPLYQWPLLVAFGLLVLELALAYTRYRRIP